MSNGLLDIVTQSSNAMSAFEMGLQINSNNSANMSTAGYKGLRYSFKTVFNDVVSEGIEDTRTSKNPTQYGSSVSLANVSLDFSQGTLGEGGAMDCGILGRGLFIVSPDGGNTYYYTRNGEFHVDVTGQYVVDSSGRMLMGTTPGGSPNSLVPVRTNGATDIGWAANGVLIDDYTNYADGKSSGTPLYQLTLADFSNVEGLTQYDGTAFKESITSGAPTSFGFSGSGQLGTIEPQQLEKSNVFYIGEAIDALEVQRAMNASLTAIKMANDMISQVTNKLFS